MNPLAILRPIADVPALPISKKRYRTRLAETAADLRAAQVLRFVVFNLELREGLEGSYDTCLDADRFDEACDHLLVEEEATGTVVGTYRMQTGTRAAELHGYYSAQEFDFTPFERLRPGMLELGRACIHSAHRNFTVLMLLWRGIVEYASRHGCRHLVGCSSLTSQDPAVAAGAFLALRSHLVSVELRTRPVGEFECPAAEPSASVKIPKLLGAYLALGARICGPPALDRQFKTIDFLTWMDLETLRPRILRHWGMSAGSNE